MREPRVKLEALGSFGRGGHVYHAPLLNPSAVLPDVWCVFTINLSNLRAANVHMRDETITVSIPCPDSCKLEPPESLPRRLRASLCGSLIRCCGNP